MDVFPLEILGEAGGGIGVAFAAGFFAFKGRQVWV